MATLESKPPILCDLGGTRIRFAVEAKPGDLARDPERPHPRIRTIHELENLDRAHPFQRALRDHALEVGGYAGREFRLSLPCRVPKGATRFEFPNLSKSWNIDVDELREEFGFCSVQVLNDAVAALFGVFDLVANKVFSPFEYVDVIRAGAMPPSGNMVLLGPGTGLGTIMADRDPKRSDDNQMVSWPKWTSFGSEPADWPADLAAAVEALRTRENDGHTRVLRQMSFALADFEEERFHQREYLVSGPGLSRLYECVTRTNVARTNPGALVAKQIVRAARSNDPQAMAAVSLFCTALGITVADFVAAEDARVAVYLVGPVLRAIGFDGFLRWGMLDAYDTRRKQLGFDAAPPIFLITHPYPELVGLSRLENLKGGDGVTFDVAAVKGNPRYQRLQNPAIASSLVGKLAKLLKANAHHRRFMGR